MRKAPEEESHTFLAIRVESHKAHVEAGINHHVFAPELGWRRDNADAPLYLFGTQLEIVGVSTYPDNRAGDTYELRLSGDDGQDSELGATLKDVQRLDERYARQYREYRGRQVPIYDPPGGLATLSKARGERRWTTWLRVAPRFVHDALVLLCSASPLFVSVHERKIGRTRWIQSLTLQTSDPAEE